MSGKSPRGAATILGRAGIQVLLLAIGAVAQAQALDEVYEFHIESQPLDAALLEFSEQSDLQLMVQTGLVAGRSSGGVNGVYTASAALQALLNDTDLRFEAVGEDTIALTQAEAGGDSDPEKPQGTPRQAMMAQASREQNDRASGQDFFAGEERDGPTSNAAVEEIVVTANRRAQRLEDVPMSVTALSQAELDREGIRSLLDLGRTVPGLVVVESGPGQNRIFMRGVANGNSATSLVGVYLDEMPVTGPSLAQLDLQLTDLERVEVLRGPQGTLYGQGSAGGTIRFITRDPDLEAYSGRINLESFDTSYGEQSERLSGVVNIPIVQDVLGVRVSGTFADIGGWIDQPAAGRKDINNQDLRHVRVKALWAPEDRLTVESFVVVHRNDGDGITSGVDAENNVAFPDGDPLAQEVLVDDYNLYNATLAYEFDGATLLASTSHSRSDKQADGYSVKFPGYESFNQDIQHVRISTQELRLSSATDGPLTWVVGTYYTDEEFDRLLVLHQYSAGVSIGTVPLPTLDTSKAWSVFGDASYQLTPRLEVGTGVRYFHDTRGQVSGGLDLDNSFHSVDPRFYASFALTPDVNLYANIGKGFRSGGFSGDTTARTFGPESVWSYEAGVKGAMLDRRLQYELTGFYSEYEDIQTFAVTTGILGGLVNTGTAHIKGVDWLVAFEAIDDFTLQASGNVTRSELVKVLPTSFTNVVGDRVDFVPDYSVSLSAEYRFDWSENVQGFARTDYNQVGKSTYTDHSSGVVAFPSDTLQFLNVRLGMRYGWLSAELFAQNLLDENGIQDPLASFGLGSRPRPRVIGVQVGVEF